MVSVRTVRTAAVARSSPGAATLPDGLADLPDPVLLLDERLVVLAANAAAAQLMSAATEELVGRPVGDLVPDAEAWAVQRAAAMASGRQEPVTVTHRLRRPDDAEVWLETRIRCVGSQGDHRRRLLAVGRDVTERVRGDQQLAAVTSAWWDVWRVMREGVVVIDRDGIVVAANEAAADFLGLDPEEVQGSLAREHVTVIDENGEPISPADLPSTRAFRTGRIQEQSVGYRRRDGSAVWLSARLVPLWHPGVAQPDRVAAMLENAVGPELADAPHPHGQLAEAARNVLTPREVDVLRMLAAGDDVRAVASALGISIHTARGHVKSLMRKLDARTQLQAVVLALRTGLLELG